MATRRKNRTEDPPEDELDLRPDEIDFLAFLEDIGPTGSIVEVYRIPRSGDPEWMDVLSFDIIRDGGQGYIRDTYGAGKYKLVFKNTGKKFQGQKTLVIGAAPAAAAAPAGAPATDLRFEFLTSQMAQDRALMFKLIENMGKGGPPPTDPAAMLTAVVTAFSVLKGASDPATQGNALKQMKDMLELVGSTKDLFGGGGEPREENMYTVIKDLGQQFLGGRGPGAASPIPRTATVQTLHPGTNTPFRVTPLRPGVNNGATQEAAAAAGTTDQPVVDAQQNAIQWIKAGLDYLKVKCKLGKPVELYMDLVWDHQEEPQFAALIQAIGNGATFENLLTFDEEIAQTPALKEWFAKLFDAVHKEIFEQVDSPGPAGHVDNSAGNAAPGPTGPPKPGSGEAGQ